MLFAWLFEKRLEAVRAFQNFASSNPDPRLFGPPSLAAGLLAAPTGPAISLYSGVSYQHLNYPALPRPAQKYLLENTIIFSNLFGPVGAEDALPLYKFKQGAKVPGLDLAKFYKAHFSAALDEFLEGEGGGEELLDLRAGFYEGFYAPSRPYFTFKFLRGGRVLSHFAKAYRGEILALAARIGAKDRALLLSALPPSLKIKERKKTGPKEEILLEILD